MPNFHRVLIVSIDPAATRRLTGCLNLPQAGGAVGCPVDTVSTCTEALARLRHTVYALILADAQVMSPGAVEMARRLAPDTDVVVFSGQAPEPAEDALRHWPRQAPGGTPPLYDSI